MRRVTFWSMRCIRGVVCLVPLAAIPLTSGVSLGQNGAIQYPVKNVPNSSPFDPKNPDGSPITPDTSEKHLKEMNTIRQKGMSSDASKLVALATELKADVGKAGDGVIPYETIHKAEQIEKLARNVSNRMKSSNPY